MAFTNGIFWLCFSVLALAALSAFTLQQTPSMQGFQEEDDATSEKRSLSAPKIPVNKHPGICDTTSRGSKVIVVGRNNNDRVLVCVRNNGGFVWRALDDFPTLGENFQPADDCSEIASKKINANNGFYWIKTPRIKKVWCDVTTDGGGFMLVGHKDTPVSWTLPSNPSELAPDSKPHWSSFFGNVSMLEFRIQVSTTNNQNETKADWLYRFKTPRQLQELFMDKQGCTSRYPGIGNIHHIKDLLSEKIVTQKFECSGFGPPYSSKLGWNRLNKCLAQECKEGYAIIPGYFGFRYDDFGSFSYSTSSQISGVSHNSTAFIGCGHGKCCACFGPKGATGDFCSPECRSFNGGTVTKNAHTWFWIRFSVPKRPFLKKCMEYIVKTEQGNEETHFIDEKTGVLKKGSCSQKGVENLVDGVVQVANKAGLDNVPLVKGLLSYRKDNEKIYLTNGRNWRALGEEKQLEMLKTKVVAANSESQKKIKLLELTNRILVMSVKSVKKNVSELAAANAELQKKVKVLAELTNLHSCDVLYKKGERKDGVYIINLDDGFGAFKVRCDMTTSGGGWTIFQRRMDGSVDFLNRGWNDYKNGFGDLNGEFWLGLDKINRLLKPRGNYLRVDMEDFSGGKAYAQYSTFAVSNETDKYKLTVGGYSGNAGDSLSYHDGMKFSTKDADNDQWNSNCVELYKGAWWYKACRQSNLNGRYLRGGTSNYYGVIWNDWKRNYSLKKTEMKIRPRSF